MSLDGKVAVITGAARGIGRAIAETLAAAGCKVVISDIQGAEETAREIQAGGAETLGLSVDVTQAESVEQMVKTTLEHFGRLDILVNNAGITRDGLLMRMKETDWDLVLSVNLKGAFLCCKAACRALMK
ncbi:MAG TPA: SDR family NAD(P)-dependent oxidoreductase, partial [Firmicutes bacterium]|nr:SDR family NAD(P)-dependent oxidoreductase [Bacillota bacterium]